MLIGIVGKARVGKDTFATALAEELFKLTRQKYVLMAYAHELKIRVQKDFDLSYEQLWGDEKEVHDKRYVKCNEKYLGDDLAVYWTPREILQCYGEFYRSIDYNFWVNRLFDIIEDREYKNVIITDVRHVNEVDPIVTRSGTLIKIVRGSDIIEATHGSNHISETALDEYNSAEFVIENNGTLEEFRVAANDVAKILISRKNK